MEKDKRGYLLIRKWVIDVLPDPDGAVRIMSLLCTVGMGGFVGKETIFMVNGEWAMVSSE